jgi:tetratricopeptide (TPR) repeat protein
MSLNNLAIRLGGLGRHEEALAAIEEAADLYRDLAEARPDVHRPNLAGSLNNLAIRLGHLGWQEEALAAIEEAVSIRRDLAKTLPAVYQDGLRQSLQVKAWLDSSGAASSPSGPA